MKKHFKSTLTLSLAFVLIFTQLAFADTTKDYEGHWGQASIEKGMSLNIVDGYPNGDYKPNNHVTRAEFVTMMDNLFQFEPVESTDFDDVKSSDWYAGAINRASAAGVVQGYNQKFRPADTITRQEAAIVIFNTFKLKAQDVSVLVPFSDNDAVATWAAHQMAALVDAGYMSGRGNNTLAPTGNLTRAEAITLLTNIVNEVILESGTVTGDFEGVVVINTADVVLENVTIEGDLYLTQGVGEGDVTLDNVTVTGKLIVLGGGVNSIILNDTTIGTLVVIKQNGLVRIVASGSTAVTEAILESGATLEETDLDGDGFGTVTILADGTVILDGDFELVSIEVPGVTVNLTEGSQVKALNTTSEATGTKVTVAIGANIGTLTLEGDATVDGEGTITTAVIKTDGSTLNIKPGTLTVDAGVTVTVEDDEIVGEEDVTPAPTPTPGPAPVPNVSIVLTMTSNTSVEVINIELPQDATSGKILEEALTYLLAEFEVLYNAYVDAGDAKLGNLLMDGLTFITYAKSSDLTGTLFADVTLPADDADADAVAVGKKAATKAVLEIVKANVLTNSNALKADLVTIAERMDFSAVTYSGEQFKSIVVSKGAVNVATYLKGSDKAVFIGNLFDELFSLTMNTRDTYTMTIVLANNDERISSIVIE